MKITFTGQRFNKMFGGWTRTCKVGEQEFYCSVTKGKSVRIPFKPRGQNRGWQWHGEVCRITSNHGRVWSGRVPGSIGVRGLLIEAGVIDCTA